MQLPPLKCAGPVALCLALLGCDGPRPADVDFEPKVCGTVSDPRDPDPPVSAMDQAITGAASWTSGGDLQVVVNPVIKGSASVGALTKDDLDVRIGGQAIVDFTVTAVSPSV